METNCGVNCTGAFTLGAACVRETGVLLPMSINKYAVFKNQVKCRTLIYYRSVAVNL